MAHIKCGSCGAVQPVRIHEMVQAVMEGMRDHQGTQQAWVQSRRLAEKGHTLGLEKLAALLDEQERVEPKSMTDAYWSWIVTLGIARAIANVARGTPEQRPAPEATDG